MAEITIQTARFGDVPVEEDRILQFVQPILGFQDSHRYILLDHAEDSPFKWLQSADEPELAFVVTNPKLFGIDYEFSIPDETVGRLGIEKPEDVVVLTIVNIPQSNPSEMTANLLGPVLINQNNRQAMQVVLSDAGFSTKTRLLSEEALQQASAGAERGE